jgi:hypothetical protein
MIDSESVLYSISLPISSDSSDKGLNRKNKFAIKGAMLLNVERLRLENCPTDPYPSQQPGLC